MRSKDRKVCENIIEVFRDKGNDKDIPVNTDSSDSESLPSEKPERKNGVIDELNFVNEDKQEEEVAAPAVPAVPAPTGENNYVAWLHVRHLQKPQRAGCNVSVRAGALLRRAYPRQRRKRKLRCEPCAHGYGRINGRNQ